MSQPSVGEQRAIVVIVGCLAVVLLAAMAIRPIDAMARPVAGAPVHELHDVPASALERRCLIFRQPE